MELYNYIRTHEDIIQVSGINWGNLYLTDPEEVKEVESLLPDRYEVYGPVDLIPEHESSIINNVFSWFTSKHKPTIKERDRLLKWLDKVEASMEFTGISLSGYPKIRERLTAMTDLEDEQVYHIHYHY